MRKNVQLHSVFVVLATKAKTPAFHNANSAIRKMDLDLVPGTVQFYLLLVRDMFRRRSVPGKR